MDLASQVAVLRIQALTAQAEDTSMALAAVKEKLNQIQQLEFRDSQTVLFINELAKVGLLPRKELKSPPWAQIRENIQKKIQTFERQIVELSAARAGIESSIQLIQQAAATIPTGGDIAKAMIEHSVKQTVDAHRESNKREVLEVMRLTQGLVS